MRKESREEAAARLGAWNPTVPDNLKDMKDLVQELWSENLALIAEMRKLRYSVAELKYEIAILKAESNAKNPSKGETK
jgi:regulator of replication initiation timing